MDYVIADHIVVKNKEYFSESLIQMEHGCMPFGSDATSFSSVFHRKDFGLPEDQIIAAVCVATDKLTQELFLTWTRCFKKVKIHVCGFYLVGQKINSKLEKFGYRRA